MSRERRGDAGADRAPENQHEVEILPDLLRPRRHPRPVWLRAVFLGAAGIAILLGVIGWLVPVVTGIPFYLLGLVFLALASDRIRSWINRLERGLAEKRRRALRRSIARIRWPRLKAPFDIPAGIYAEVERRQRRLGR